jgi:hypothetical protein
MPDQIPDALIRMYPNVAPDAWVRLSEHRYRATHPSPGGQYAIVAVTVFDTTMARGVKAGAEGERDAFADLIESAARDAAHRVSCTEGTPITRPDNEANRGVEGRCWWCGCFPRQHVTAEDRDESEREWAAGGQATATDPDPDYGKDLDDEDDSEDDDEPF